MEDLIQTPHQVLHGFGLHLQLHSNPHYCGHRMFVRTFFGYILVALCSIVLIFLHDAIN